MADESSAIEIAIEISAMTGVLTQRFVTQSAESIPNQRIQNPPNCFDQDLNCRNQCLPSACRALGRDRFLTRKKR
jgi:hypothetical protein